MFKPSCYLSLRIGKNWTNIGMYVHPYGIITAISPTSVTSYYISVSALYTWAMEEGFIEHKPMANV